MFVQTLPDTRDHTLPGSEILPEVDLSPWIVDMENQLWLSSCTAHAGTTAHELLLNKSGKRIEFDRHFLFHEIRKLSGNPEWGADVRMICKAMHKVGNAPSRWFDNLMYLAGCAFSSWRRKPSAKKYKEAEKYRISSYASVADIRSALSAGLPVIAGLKLRKAFKDCDFSEYENSPEWMNHALVVIGYKDDSYLLVNSWGRGWGDDGLCWMPAGLFERDCFDKWVAII